MEGTQGVLTVQGLGGTIRALPRCALRLFNIWNAHLCMRRTEKLPQYISRQPSRQEMCPVMADDSSEIAD